VSREIDRVDRRLEDVPEDGVLYLARRDVSALECGLGRLDGEIDRRIVFQRAAKSAEGRADRGQEDDVAV
jgi:hypothetical protein